MLAAAERIVIEDGLRALSARRLSEAAGTALSQIAYHFDGLPGLVQVLIDSNATLVNDARDGEHASALSTGPDDLSVLLAAYLRPVGVASAWWPDGHASLVLQELHRHASPAARAAVSASLERHRRPLLDLIAPLVPHLDAQTFHVRIVMLMASAITLIPGSHAWGLLGPAARTAHDDLFANLLAFGTAALRAPAGPV